MCLSSGLQLQLSNLRHELFGLFFSRVIEQTSPNAIQIGKRVKHGPQKTHYFGVDLTNEVDSFSFIETFFG